MLRHLNQTKRKIITDCMHCDFFATTCAKQQITLLEKNAFHWSIAL
jgi:hypothetical protein